MATGRFIVRFRGEGSIPAEDVERLRALPDINIIDSTSRMLLVDAPSDKLESLISSMPEWIMSEERMVSRPDPRPKIQQDFDKKK
jgi:hypothetical protein